MKNVLPAFAAAAVLAGAVLSALFASGCEDANSYSISVSPNYAKIKPGQSVALHASGWENYRWTLDNENGAHLSATTGKSVIFYAETGAASAVYNVTVAAIGSSTSTNSAGYTAKAKIVIEGVSKATSSSTSSSTSRSGTNSVVSAGSTSRSSTNSVDSAGSASK